MRPIFLLTLLATGFGSLKAQSVYTTNLEGRTVFVFPYRLEGNWKNSTAEHRFFGSNSQLVDIPYSPVALPDGEYIAYCPMPTPRFNKKEGRQYYLKTDTTVLAARFFVRNNLKQGPAEFYNTRTYDGGKQRVCYRGMYVKDRKEGNWTQITYNYYGIVADSTHIPFKNNLIDGEVVRYSGTGVRYQTSRYEAGQKNGETRTYDKDGNVRSYTQYKNDAKHGWDWDSTSVTNKKNPYQESKMRWFQNGRFTQEGRFTFKNENYSYVRTVRILDSIDMQTAAGFRQRQDSGIWYAENYSSMSGMGSWPHDISPDYRSREWIQNKRFESTVVYGNGNSTTVYFIGRARRVEEYEMDYTLKSGKDAKKQVHETLRHIGYDSTYGNLFHIKRWEDGNLVRENYYGLRDFRAQELREVVHKENSSGNMRYAVETKPGYFTAILKLPIPAVYTSDSVQTNDKNGQLYYRLVRRNVITKDSVYILTERQDNDRKKEARLKPLRMEIIRHADSTLTLKQFVGFQELPQLQELVTVHTKPGAPPANRYLLLEDENLSKTTFLYSMEYGFPDRSRSTLLLNGKPFTGGWNLHLDKRKVRDSRSGEEVEDLEDFKLVQIKRRFLPGYDTFIHVKAAGLPAWINPRSVEESDYPNYKKVKHLQAEVYSQWMNGVLSGRASAWDEHSARKVKADYAMGRKHGTEAFQWENEHGQIQGFHNHYENGERVGNYTDPFNHLQRQIRPYRRNKPDGLHIMSGDDADRQVSFFMRQGQPDLHIIRSETNTGWIRDSLPLTNGIPNGLYRSYWTRFESNSGPDMDRMSDEELVEYAGRGQVETAMPSTARIPRSEVYFNQGIAEGKARFWFEKGGIKAEVTFRPEDSMRLFKIITANDGFELSGLKEVRPNLSIRSMNSGKMLRSELRELSLEDSYAPEFNRGSTIVRPRKPYYLEYRRAVDYEEDGLSDRNANWLELSNSWTADYRYFFTNGQVSQEGRVENGQRSGWWTFRNESGNKLKEIEYTSGEVLAPNGSGDTLRYKGRIRGYHPKGYVLYEGYVMDASFSYSCATETDLSFEDIWYTAFYDSAGNQTLQQYSGKVYDFHVNTVKRMDGFIRNGLYDSTWYRYSIGGTLESAGKYRNGRKDGRWLLGDLEGINFLDNQCFDAGDEWRMMQLANELDFTEEIWDNGNLIRTSTLNIRKDGSADDYTPGTYGDMPWLWGKKRIRGMQERAFYRDPEEDDDDDNFRRRKYNHADF